MPSSTTAKRRMPLSCEPCRERKIRCSRNPPGSQGHGHGGPCATCVRRCIPSHQCIYLRDIQRNRTTVQPGVQSVRGRHQDTGESNASLLERMNNLERLLELNLSGSGGRDWSRLSPVVAQFQSQFPSPETDIPTDPSSTDALVLDGGDSCTLVNLSTRPSTRSYGSLVRSKSGHERYVPSFSRWASILATTHGFEAPIVEFDEDESKVLPWQPTNITLDECLCLLPPASSCDQLKTIFLHIYAPLFHILHDPSFEAAYAKFRDEPATVSFSWLALLFAVLSVAISAVQSTDPLLSDLGHRKTPLENITILLARYRSAAMKCLEADGYLYRHNMHTLQTLVILIYGINHTHGQSWALLGTTKNIALSLGCHVDPDAFSLNLIDAEERRRCWAGVLMLYTIQNTTLGSLEGNQITTNVKPPLDVDDIELNRGAASSMPSRAGPSQMSYLLLKFKLYQLCERICNIIFNVQEQPGYDTILQLNTEIKAQQCHFTNKYFNDTLDQAESPFQEVHFNILVAYSHQLTLLLHRPVLIEHFLGDAGDSTYLPQDFAASRQCCIESARALLAIQRCLHETEKYKPYEWYNRGLGSFQAFHAAVLLLYMSRLDGSLNRETQGIIELELRSSLEVFDRINDSGLSPFCRRAAPTLRKLVEAIPLKSSQSHSQELSDAGQSLRRDTSDDGAAWNGAGSEKRGCSMEFILGNLGAQQWLSPSMVNWNEWDTMMSEF